MAHGAHVGIKTRVLYFVTNLILILISRKNTFLVSLVFFVIINLHIETQVVKIELYTYMQFENSAWNSIRYAV